MSVILKKDEKIKTVIDSLPENFTDNDFLRAFKNMYPNDYDKCMNVWLEEERNTKPGKHHPMPHPDKYIINALHVYQSKKEKGFRCTNELNMMEK